jgi:hypothetical protein
MNDHVYSNDDMPAGETDSKLEKFSLAPDEAAVIPVLKEILAINPELKILRSPWSAPAWMKTNDAVKGDNLRPEFGGCTGCYGAITLDGNNARFNVAYYALAHFSQICKAWRHAHRIRPDGTAVNGCFSSGRRKHCVDCGRYRQFSKDVQNCVSRNKHHDDAALGVGSYVCVMS